MALDYNEFVTDIRTLLRANATTTALGLSLTSDYQMASDHINLGYSENIPVEVDRYPHIFISLKNAEEEIANIGIASNGVRRHVNLFVDINAFVWVGSDSDDSDKCARSLARNIHSVFRSNTFYSGTVGWDLALLNNTVFSRSYVEPNNRDTYLSAVRIEARFEKKSVI